MSYTKHTWETGETITADKLNNIENSVSKISENTIMVINIRLQKLEMEFFLGLHL